MYGDKTIGHVLRILHLALARDLANPGLHHCLTSSPVSHSDFLCLFGLYYIPADTICYRTDSTLPIMYRINPWHQTFPGPLEAPQLNNGDAGGWFL
jgi:hypothetical protein